MGLTPDFKLFINSKDITGEIKKYNHSISFNDKVGQSTDTLTINLSGNLKRPQYNDKIKLYLGHKETGLYYCGLFKVNNISRKNNINLSISGLSMTLTAGIRKVKNRSFESVSLADICYTIGSEHGLRVKTDYDRFRLSHIAQINESDYSFLMRLAKEYNATFSIKNDTLIFYTSEQNSKKEKIKIDVNKVHDIEIKYSYRTIYKSCKAVWHDTKENKTKSLMVGESEPTIILNDSFPSDEVATERATARLRTVNSGAKTGNIKLEGMPLFAGLEIELFNNFDSVDNGIYKVKNARHNYSNSSYTVSVDISL
jgi:phage protein D